MVRRGIALVVSLGAMLALVPAAHADHHFVKIREYYPGLLATPNDGFLELQMFASGQNEMGGQEIHVYDSTQTAPEPAVFVLNPSLPIPPNAENQRTVLIAGTSGPADRDYPENLDTEYDPAGGALCFVSVSGFGEIDCLEWGSGSPLVAAGNPAAPTGIPDGQSLNRSIAPGCSTLLESGDDSDDSAADFALAAPSPRPNSAPVTEQVCPPGGGGGGGGNGPDTEITKAPKKKTPKAKAKFKFRSTVAGSSFECKLDKGQFKPCSSPRKYKRLDRGKHRFQVRAVAPDGTPDPTPAKHRWKVTA